MSDTYTLHLENFRSIRDATVEIAPLTVIYGPNGSGKSSLIYGLLTLRNFFTNPAQNIPSLFSYPTISLGGLREVVHNHAEDEASVPVSWRFAVQHWSFSCHGAVSWITLAECSAFCLTTRANWLHWSR